MSIIRAPRVERDFYVLDKKIASDPTLSWAGRGMLIFLLTKPDHWAVSVEHLKSETAKSAKPTGRDGVYSLLGELETSGYLQRYQDRTADGRMGAWHYLVHETPFFPHPEKPEAVRPSPGSPDPDSPDSAKTTLVNTDQKKELNLSKDRGRRMAPPQEASGIVFQLKQGAQVDLPAAFVAEMRRCYPTVDVDAELRSAQAWCVAAEERDKKTQSGIRRFVASWLKVAAQDERLRREARAANRAPRNATQAAGGDALDLAFEQASLGDVFDVAAREVKP